MAKKAVPTSEGDADAPQPTDERKTISCCACEKSAKINKRLPTGWKNFNGSYYSPDCWNKRYILRAITFKVAKPILPVELDWKGFRERLKEYWRENTRASNWMIRQLMLRDVIRGPEMKKMPPRERTYLYPEARKMFPSLPPSCIASLENSITAKYSAKRYELIWTLGASLPSYRYPQPFAIPNQCWSARKVGDAPVIDLKLGEGNPISVALQHGARYRKQMTQLSAILAGNAIQGECSIYEHDSDVMIKLVAWLPRRAASSVQKEGVLRVRSAADSLLVAVMANDKDEARIWRYNGDHVRRWVAEHKSQLQRWAEDTKAEQRPVAAFTNRRALASTKYHRRIKSATDEAAKALVNFAVRQKVVSIIYDDSNRAFCPDFGWFRLADRIKNLCDEFDLELELAPGLLNPADDLTVGSDQAKSSGASA